MSRWLTPGRAVGIAFLVTLAFFWPTLRSFPGVWTQYGMGHGWLIAALVAWLIWRHREEFLTGTRGDWLLLIPLGAMSLVWFFATVAHIQVIHQLAFVAILVLWGLAAFGRPAARTVLALGATFLIALPMWSVLTPPLRRMTTLASGGLINLTGIENQIQGDVIHIAVGSFLVEDGCAGLAYFVAALAIGALYAHLFARSWPRQLAIVALAAGIAIVGNWIRVAALIVIGHVTEMQSGLIESHHGFGWVIFAASLVPFFFLARRIEGGKKREAQPGGEGTRAHVAPADSAEALRKADGAPTATVPVGRLLPTGALAVAGPLLYLVIGALPAGEPRTLDLRELAAGDGWELEEGSEARPFDWRPHFPGAHEHRTASFSNGSGHVYVDHFVYREQSQGAKLIGYPNRMADGPDIVDQRAIGPVDPTGRRWIRQALIRTEDGGILVWYWYRVGGVETFSRVQAKVLEIPAFLTRRLSAELVALSVACGPEDCRGAFETLAAFTGQRRRDQPSGPPVQETLPGDETPEIPQP